SRPGPASLLVRRRGRSLELVGRLPRDGLLRLPAKGLGVLHAHVLLEHLGAIVSLVEHDVAGIVLIVQHVELPAAGLALHRGLRVDRDDLVELVRALGLHLQLDNENEVAQENSLTMKSISTSAPRVSALTPMQLRAGTLAP